MNRENPFLYTLSGIACILVVFIHVQFPGYVGRVLLPITRFAVPYFFALSGYYYNNDKSKQGGGKFRKFTILFLKIWFCYLALSAISYVIEGNSFDVWLDEKFTLGNTVSLLLFNHSHLLEINEFTADALWFLPALAYVYFFMQYCGRFILKYRKGIIIDLGTVLMLGQYVLTGKSFNLVNEIISAPVLVNNWLFDGLFFFLLGSQLKETRKDVKYRNINITMFICLFVVLSVFSLAESIIHTSDIYIGSILIVVLIFSVADRYCQRRVNILYYIGKNLSSNVYYWHIFIKAFIILIIGKSVMEKTSFLFPLIVLIITLVFSYILYLIKIKRKEYEVYHKR